MKTKGDCLAMYLRFLDEATKKGISLPTTKNADYRDKFGYLVSEAQTYVASIIKIPSVYTITQFPIPNQLELLQGFDAVQYLPGTPKIFTFIGTKSYYFEINNVGTITIKINGVTTQTINNTVKRIFTPYKANTGANDTDVVTFIFDGLYPYNIKNTGFYPYPFPTDSDVQVYMPFVDYDMPSDFMSFDIVTLKSDPRIYESYVEYKWENNRKVILNYYDTGSFDIHYYAKPVEILPTDLDSVPMSVDDKAVGLVAMWTAVLATTGEPDKSLSSWLRSLFQEQIRNMTGDSQISDSSVQTVFNMM